MKKKSKKKTSMKQSKKPGSCFLSLIVPGAALLIVGIAILDTRIAGGIGLILAGLALIFVGFFTKIKDRKN